MLAVGRRRRRWGGLPKVRLRRLGFLRKAWLNGEVDATRLTSREIGERLGATPIMDVSFELWGARLTWGWARPRGLGASTASGAWRRAARSD